MAIPIPPYYENYFAFKLERYEEDRHEWDKLKKLYPQFDIGLFFGFDRKMKEPLFEKQSEKYE